MMIKMKMRIKIKMKITVDDCGRTERLHILYFKGKITIPKQSECNVNSYTKIWYHFVC